jgi:hypothetical protein
MARWSLEPLEVRNLTEAESLISLLRDAPFESDLWGVQNTYYELMKAIKHVKPGTASGTWFRLFRSLGDSLGIAAPQIIARAPEKKLMVVSLPQAPQPQLIVSAEC